MEMNTNTPEDSDDEDTMCGCVGVLNSQSLHAPTCGSVCGVTSSLRTGASNRFLSLASVEVNHQTAVVCLNARCSYLTTLHATCIGVRFGVYDTVYVDFQRAFNNTTTNEFEPPDACQRTSISTIFNAHINISK